MPRGKRGKPTAPKLPKKGEPGYELTFGYRLDREMAKQPDDMTDRSLGKDIGVSHGTVFQWRHNMARSPEAGNLQKLLRRLPNLEVRDPPAISEPGKQEQRRDIQGTQSASPVPNLWTARKLGEIEGRYPYPEVRELVAEIRRLNVIVWQRGEEAADVVKKLRDLAAQVEVRGK